MCRDVVDKTSQSLVNFTVVVLELSPAGSLEGFQSRAAAQQGLATKHSCGQL
jgi:hypothetical protein